MWLVYWPHSAHGRPVVLSAYDRSLTGACLSNKLESWYVVAVRRSSSCAADGGDGGAGDTDGGGGDGEGEGGGGDSAERAPNSQRFHSGAKLVPETM